MMDGHGKLSLWRQGSTPGRNQQTEGRLQPDDGCCLQSSGHYLAVNRRNDRSCGILACRHGKWPLWPSSPDAAITEPNMSNVTELIDRYIAMWNETDKTRRRDLIAETRTRTASYLDPVMQGEGPAGIDAMVRSVQERFP